MYIHFIFSINKVTKKYILIVPDVTRGAKKLQFLLIYSTIYADVGGWVGLKNTKNWKKFLYLL